MSHSGSRLFSSGCVVFSDDLVVPWLADLLVDAHNSLAVLLIDLQDHLSDVELVETDQLAEERISSAGRGKLE